LKRNLSKKRKPERRADSEGGEGHFVQVGLKDDLNFLSLAGGMTPRGNLPRRGASKRWGRGRLPRRQGDK